LLFVAINVEIKNEAVDDWVDFEMDAKPINQASFEILFSKKIVHGHVNKHCNDVIIGPSCAHDNRYWIEQPKSNV
jgi:hypothetical protein